MSKQAVADVGGIPEYNSEVCSNLAPEPVRLAYEGVELAAGGTLVSRLCRRAKETMEEFVVW